MKLIFFIVPDLRVRGREHTIFGIQRRGFWQRRSHMQVNIMAKQNRTQVGSTSGFCLGALLPIHLLLGRRTKESLAVSRWVRESIIVQLLSHYIDLETEKKNISWKCMLS